MADDLELIDSYLSGSEDAIEELVARYQKQMFAFIYRLTNDMEDTKDLLQKTFINAVKGLRDFRREASFKTWLYHIAHNTCINHFKQNRREEVELDETLGTREEETLGALINKEKVELVRSAVMELPKRQRLALVLRAYEGLSCIETARVMDCSEGAVKAHYHHAVNNLREIIRKRGYEVRA